MDLLIIFTICAVSILAGYIVGYMKGFNKCKRIDNNIIDELANKYKL